MKLIRVQPTNDEKALVKLIAAPIQKLNRLSQISLAQALMSSPQALVTQLENMADNGTVSYSLAENARTITKDLLVTSKLQSIKTLSDQLKSRRSRDWRMVIFTGRRATQKAIGTFLQSKGIRCGYIGGESFQGNQTTINQFKQNPPLINVVISTETGSEGINLQVCNVLVNYDLPWNPMIVEQRIGRIQRLASNHASVSVFNIILKGTVEEKIVGRLMEKLQMATHAIGEVESLLEAAHMDEEDDVSSSFEDMIRKLVIASLAGKDIKIWGQPLTIKKLIQGSRPKYSRIGIKG